MPVGAFWSQINIPYIDIWQLMFENDKPFPDDQIMYIDSETNRSLTYAQTRAAALQFGRGLQSEWHWQKDDVLAIFAPNCIDTPSVIWGCHWSGGIITPANPVSKPEELAFQLKDAGAKALVTHMSCLAVAKAAARLAGLPESRVIVIGDQQDPERKVKHASNIRDSMGSQNFSRPNLDPKKDIAFLAYSSGTTGWPKGVMLTHTNIVSNVLQMEKGMSTFLNWNGGADERGDKVIAFLPFFHIYALTVLLHEYGYRGIPLVVMPRFDLEKFCKLAQTHAASFACIVPPVALLLSKHPLVDKYDLSSLKGMTCAAAPLTQDLIHALYKRLKVPLTQVYGLSETSPCATVQPVEDAFQYPGSVGKLCSNMTAKVVDLETGKEVPAGTEGELLFSGPNVFKGYLNNPSGTANAFTKEGYFKTGDVGYVDGEGNFYITDRVKELIKYKGFQVAPAQLEGLLIAHPSVNDAAVIGVYSVNGATELPRAYIVLADRIEKSEKTANEIAKWLEVKVSNYKKLRGGVRFLDVIPKSATGKILRRVLRDEAAKEMNDKSKAVMPKL